MPFISNFLCFALVDQLCICYTISRKRSEQYAICRGILTATCLFVDISRNGSGIYYNASDLPFI
ncbi:MAG: hypothetical protein FKGGLIKP_00254 [Sodalis sp. Fse]|nr:MAG: hypothetical protein FKGGLIKP_00254 [Sodalis sp. Fse]